MDCQYGCSTQDDVCGVFMLSGQYDIQVDWLNAFNNYMKKTEIRTQYTLLGKTVHNWTFNYVVEAAT